METSRSVRVAKTEGFSLLEVIIALSVLTTAVVTIIYTINTHLNLIQKQSIVTKGVFYAKNLIEEDSFRDRTEVDGFRVRVTKEESPFEGLFLYRIVLLKDGEEIEFLKAASK